MILHARLMARKAGLMLHAACACASLEDNGSEAEASDISAAATKPLRVLVRVAVRVPLRSTLAVQLIVELLFSSVDIGQLRLQLSRMLTLSYRLSAAAAAIARSRRTGAGRPLAALRRSTAVARTPPPLVSLYWPHRCR
ncbi:hypothetical protein BX592_1153 [Paraburkholderia rhizosphaerae]|uniref:Secreted protein n=1 Tax=Paraburkholderia rhizosphaerae TaxID=480658 RepID=A0A4R8LKL5_9BURK|nr:hypothetical protein BX592_1153 [Paraburkholderia rhizosphaerae]